MLCQTPGLHLPAINILQEKRASCHKSCRNRYRNAMLVCAKERHIHNATSVRVLPRREPKEKINQLCLFCGIETSSNDHSFQKLDLTEAKYDKAVRLGEDRIVAQLSEVT